tara:strand:+ start:426 stop:617 length:192 start_codon:yes stop_codon:yes gene_type:complete
MNKAETMAFLRGAAGKGSDDFLKAIRKLELDRRRKETRFTVDSKGRVKKNFKNGGLINFKGSF